MTYNDPYVAYVFASKRMEDDFCSKQLQSGARFCLTNQTPWVNMDLTLKLTPMDDDNV